MNPRRHTIIKANPKYFLPIKINKERVPSISISDELLDRLPDANHIAVYVMIERYCYDNQPLEESFIAERLKIDLEVVEKCLEFFIKNRYIKKS